MQKIISLFQRNYDGDRLVRNEIVPGAEWVINGEGWATRKWDGTCCKIEGGMLFKRYDAKHGKTPPPDFVPAQPNPDPVSGHWPGWVPVDPLSRENRWYVEALDNDDAIPGDYVDQTYELCGPKVNGNPEGLDRHMFLPHGWPRLPDAPRDFDGLKSYLDGGGIEGIVWWHPDGHMVKIKAKDFGVKR